MLSAIVLVVIGCALLYWRKRRQFGRINQYGHVEYVGYNEMILSHVLDGTIQIVGIVSIFVGLVLSVIDEMYLIIVLDTFAVVYVLLVREECRRCG